MCSDSNNESKPRSADAIIAESYVHLVGELEQSLREEIRRRREESAIHASRLESEKAAHEKAFQAICKERDHEREMKESAQEQVQEDLTNPARWKELLIYWETLNPNALWSFIDEFTPRDPRVK